MNTKICIYCKKEFQAKRNDAKFCSSTCKARHWDTHNKKQEKIKQDDNEKEQKQSATAKTSLRGVINTNSNKQTTTKEIQVETGEHLTFKKQLDNLLTTKKRLIKEKNQYISQKGAIERKNGQLLKLTGTGVGAYLGDIGFKNKTNNIIGGLAGLLITNSIDNTFFKKNREERKIKEIAELNDKIKPIDVQLTSVEVKINQLNFRMFGVERYKTITTEVPGQPTSILGELKLLPKTKSLTKKEPENDTDNKAPKNETKRLIEQEQNQPETSAKIIKSTDLDNIDYEAFNFKGKWYDFIGHPSIDFHCTIHGKPGEGKSTFAIQFAKYLADNFGKVIYISGEEGFSMTLKDKFVNNKAQSQYLYIADLRTYDDIIKEIKPDEYNFIFIDSLDNMRIGIKEFKELRKIYKGSALITISQSTKDGKMRGSNEIAHDSDTQIEVKDGVATTIKNRFEKKYREFQVF